MVTVSCHCKNVKLRFEQLPTQVRDCDCPMCNRLGALWADFLSSEVQIELTNQTATYQWADGDYEMHHCQSCGCSTHYISRDANPDSEIGINMRMLDRRLLEKIPIA